MSLRKMAVLVVDDNSTDRLIVSSILQKLKVQTVHEAENGVVAESKLITACDVHKPYDVVILDWNMPNTNGLKLLQHMRTDTRLWKTHVIVMTATSNREVVEEAIENGAQDFIVKPIAFETLREKLDKVGAS